jgi:hypothetical protein
MMVDELRKGMSPPFAKLYSVVGRPSITPERLLRSLLLQIFYQERSSTFRFSIIFQLPAALSCVNAAVPAN